MTGRAAMFICKRLAFTVVVCACPAPVPGDKATETVSSSTTTGQTSSATTGSTTTVPPPTTSTTDTGAPDFPQCDPIAPNCPDPTNLCISNPRNPSAFICVLDPNFTESLFAPCEYVNACDRGLHCAASDLAVECNQQSPGCCLPFCDTDEPNTCPGQSQECVPWYSDPADAAPFNVDVGLCRLPVP